MDAIDDDRPVGRQVAAPSGDALGVASYRSRDLPVIGRKGGLAADIDDERRRCRAERATERLWRKGVLRFDVHELSLALRVEQSLDDEPSWSSRESADPDGAIFTPAEFAAQALSFVKESGSDLSRSFIRSMAE
jgi:hypothetical protein